MLLVSHSMEDIARYVERILVMNHGEKVFDGVPKEVFSHYKELESIGLAAPQITYIMHALRENGPSDRHFRYYRRRSQKQYFKSTGERRKMIRDITIGQYYPADSSLHRLDPRVKFIGTFLFLISLFVADSFWGYVSGHLFSGRYHPSFQGAGKIYGKGAETPVHYPSDNGSFQPVPDPGKRSLESGISDHYSGRDPAGGKDRYTADLSGHRLFRNDPYHHA